MADDEFTEAARTEAPPVCEHYWISHSQDSALIPWVIRCCSCGAFNTAEMDHLARDYLASQGWLVSLEVAELLAGQLKKAEGNVRAREEMINRLAGQLEKVEKERDGALAAVSETEGRAQVPLAEWEKELIRATENPRTPTTDEIEAVLHDVLPLTTARLGDEDIAEIAFNLHAALAEPTRPEGAEEIEAILDELPDTDLPITDAGRADLLAERGVRLQTEPTDGCCHAR